MMKRMNLAVICTAMMALLGFTSCLDSKNGTTTGQWVGIVKVNSASGYYQFKSADGSTIVPSNQSDLQGKGLENYTFAYVMATYNTEDLSQGSASVPMQISGVSPIKSSAVNSGTGDGMAAFSNSSVAFVSNDASNGMVTFYSTQDMFVPVSYYYKPYSQGSAELTDELNKHSFALFYDVKAVSEGALTFHLRHQVQDEALNKERTSRGAEYLHFNIAAAVQEYRLEKGGLPQTIQIEYLQGTTTGELGTALSAQLSAPVSYQQVCEELGQIQK